MVFEKTKNKPESILLPAMIMSMIITLISNMICTS